jgi:hypothetical protein
LLTILRYVERNPLSGHKGVRPEWHLNFSNTMRPFAFCNVRVVRA